MMTGQQLIRSHDMAGKPHVRRPWPLNVVLEIGPEARLLSPAGVRIEEEPWRHAEAMDRTTVPIVDLTVSSVFMGAFEREGVRMHLFSALQRAERSRPSPSSLSNGTVLTPFVRRRQWRNAAESLPKQWGGVPASRRLQFH